MYNFFGTVLASMISELCQEVLARKLQGIFLIMIFIIIFLCVRTKNPLKKRFEKISKNRKVYEVKGVLMCAVLLKYRCVCFGMVLAQIHPYIQEDFTTLITHIQRILS